jgi:hypothetical protein
MMPLARFRPGPMPTTAVEPPRLDREEARVLHMFLRSAREDRLAYAKDLGLSIGETETLTVALGKQLARLKRAMAP